MSAPVQTREVTWADVNRDVIRTVGMPGNTYFFWMTIIALTLACGVAAWTYQIYIGMGAAGKRTPQMWAMYITTFVFWIGIGHAGTLISAVLYLFRAKWRTSIYRGRRGGALIFAVMTAGLFPSYTRPDVVDTGDAYPNSAYLPNSRRRGVGRVRIHLQDHQIVFSWGPDPRHRRLRDSATGFKKKLHRCAGWEGSATQWKHYRRATASSPPGHAAGLQCTAWCPSTSQGARAGLDSTLFAPSRGRAILRLCDGPSYPAHALVLQRYAYSRTGTGREAKLTSHSLGSVLYVCGGCGV